MLRVRDGISDGDGERGKQAPAPETRFPRWEYVPVDFSIVYDTVNHGD